MNRVGEKNEETRVNWLEKTLRELPAGSKILDAGAGEQRFRKYCSHLEYVAQDFGKYDGVGDSKGLQTGKWDQTGLDIVSDIAAIPAPDKSFDVILCVEVLEHLPEPTLALREFSRLLRNGGELILTTPFCSLTHFAPFHFHSGFNRYFFETHFAKFHLEITEMTENGNFFEFLAQELRRAETIAQQFAGTGFNPLEKAARRILLSHLNRMSKKDRGSRELLHFGWMIRAVRK
jgi:2-polyprenyl-3-methyl-5-hydroxy-6-metoxy-1,4-benzoquinol methylase